jgi:hypothetical protein
VRRLAIATLFALSCAVSSAQAAVYTIDIDVLLQGTAVAGDSTVATLRFEDVGSDTVRLTVTSSLIDIDEFISDISFNVAGFNPADITATYLAASKVGAFDDPSLTWGANNQDPVGPGAGFDYLYAFTVGGGPNGGLRFNLSDSFQYDFSATGLQAVNFVAANSQGYFGYAHVQGIGPTAGNSSIYVSTDPGDPNTPVVPEPTSLLLLATGLIAGARRLAKR